MRPKIAIYDALTLSIIAISAGAAGIFWGADLTAGGPFVFFNIDEGRYCKQAIGYFDVGAFTITNYFYGFVRETQPFLFLLKNITGKLTPLSVLITGRVVNLFFAAANTALVYFLANRIFKNRTIAFLSGVFLGFAPLHIINSHFSLPLVSCVFWTYLSLGASMIFLETKKWAWWFTACFASGAAIAVKFAAVTILPLLYIFFTVRDKRRLVWLGLLIVSVIFLFFNFWHFPWEHYKIISESIPDNFLGRPHIRWANPWVYMIGLIPGVGLPAFLLALAGFFFLARSGFYDFTGNPSVRNRFICFEIPLMVYGAVICLMTWPFIRHALPLAPYLVIAAGYGSYETLKFLGEKYSKKVVFAFLALVFSYQLVSVIWLENRFVNDPYFRARKWLLADMKGGEKAWFFARCPTIMWIRNLFPVSAIASSLKEANYLVLREGVLTYLTKRSPLNPLTSSPGIEQVSAGRYLLEDPLFIREAILGKTDFKLAAFFPAPEIMPEFYLYKKIFGVYAPSSLEPGDISIYKRVRS